MGTKYTSQSISGYNASPPPDDGSKVSANVLKWSNHISKIGNPLKALAEAINSALVTHLDRGPAVAKTANYVTTTADHNTVIPFDDTGLTCSLLAPATAGAGYQVTIKNLNSDALTVDVSGGSTIDGASSLSLEENESFVFIVNDDASAYYAESSRRNLAAAIPGVVTGAFLASMAADATFQAGLTTNGFLKFAANDEILWRGNTVPAGFTTVAVHNKAIRINSGSVAATADGGTNAFSTALNSAFSSSSGGAHTHGGSTLAVSSLSHNQIGGTTVGSSSWTINASSHNHTISGNTGSGGSHSHTLSLDIQYRDYRAIKKT